jgi:hypothetical protein
MGVIALLWLINTVYAVLVDGRPATVFFWIVMAMNLGWVTVSFWLYRRAAQSPPTQS